jgi:hypothetical protein
MSPDSEPELAEVLDQLVKREPIFHRPEFGTTRAEFERMTVADFWEVGASGRRYTRDFVLDTLEERYRSPIVEVWETTDFQCRRLARGVYLLTYTLLQENTRKTRRSTIWQRTEEGWKIVYHQGTMAQGS